MSAGRRCPTSTRLCLSSDAASVLTMASNVWVFVAKDEKYIRGSEIIEVRVRTSRGSSYGKEYSEGIVSITQARTSDEAGTSPRTLELWTFASRPPADDAAQRLLSALSLDHPSIVRLDSDNEVHAMPTATL